MSKAAPYFICVFYGLACGIATPTYAAPTSAFEKAFIDDATPYIDLRYRFEDVHQEGLENHANASTLRTKLGYKTGELYHASATFEVANITYLGEERFNNTLNGRTVYPVVADPDSTELNHAFLTFTGVQDTVFHIGRQPHNLDNQRFIGVVGWRQNDQSYDSLAVTNVSLPDTELFYSYVYNVNRIFSDDHPQGDLDANAHIVNIAYKGFSVGTLTGYSYLLDFNERFAYGLSSKTFGARFVGDTEICENAKLLYVAEYARQSDYGNYPTSLGANYYLLEGGVSVSGFATKTGYEVLGSDNDGSAAFQTPLATLHGHNGWADKFLTTPVGGLEDAYASIFYQISDTEKVLIDGMSLGVIYHHFSAETGAAVYGDEWNAVIQRDFKKHYSVMVKYADYDAKSFSTDTQKLWVQLGVKF